MEFVPTGSASMYTMPLMKPLARKKLEQMPSLILFLLLILQPCVQIGVADDMDKLNISKAHFKFVPSAIELYKDDTASVYFNISDQFLALLKKDYKENRSYSLTVTPKDRDIAYPFTHLPATLDKEEDADDDIHQIVVQLLPDHYHNETHIHFYVIGSHVGRTILSIYLSVTISGLNDTESSSLLKLDDLQVSVTRHQRMVDVAFNVIVSVITLLNSYAVGCVTDLDVIKKEFVKPQIYIVMLGFCSQFIIMPALAFSVAKMLSLNTSLGLGLLFVATVPGGGLGHLIVIITGNADKGISMAMNLVSTTAALVMAPLWMYTLGQFFPTISGQIEIPFHMMELCLACVILPYVLGVLTFRFKPPAAEAMLNWLIKPLLLLVSILFITLGIYINMYMFDIIDKFAIIAGIFMPFIGFGVGGLLAIIARQKKPVVKAMATETALSNCTLVMVTLRYSLKQPDADICSAMPMWVLLFSPIPFVLMLIVHKVKKKTLEYCYTRRQKQKQHMMILQSFANMTKNMAGISGLAAALLPKSDEKSEENGSVELKENDKSRRISSEDGTIGEEPSTAQSML